MQRLPPLAQRLHTDFATDARFDNPRAVQIVLPGFDLDAPSAVGVKVRDLFADEAMDPAKIRTVVDDEYLADLARGIAGRLGGRVGIAPRLYLRKLVADVLDRVDQFSDFDPRRHYAPTIDDHEMTRTERAAADASNVDDIERVRDRSLRRASSSVALSHSQHDRMARLAAGTIRSRRAYVGWRERPRLGSNRRR